MQKESSATWSGEELSDALLSGTRADKERISAYFKEVLERSPDINPEFVEPPRPGVVRYDSLVSTEEDVRALPLDVQAKIRAAHQLRPGGRVVLTQTASFAEDTPEVRRALTDTKGFKLLKNKNSIPR